MKITILGCGSSGGVPLIGNVWGDCDPQNPKNKRTCCSILVEEGDQKLLVDTSPDMREQLLRADVKSLSAVLYTHAHADHCHGIDGLRSINWLTQKPVPIYGSQATIEELQTRFAYIFGDRDPAKRYYRPSVEPHIIEGDLSFGSIRVSTFEMKHGEIKSTGYRFNDFAYTTDVHAFDEDAYQALDGVKVWVLDCARRRPHPTHMNLEGALKAIERVRPEKTYLTHMDHSMDYETLVATLPSGVVPAYDGLEITCLF